MLGAMKVFIFFFLLWMIWKYEKYLFDLRLAFVSFKMKNQRKEFFFSSRDCDANKRRGMDSRKNVDDSRILMRGSVWIGAFNCIISSTNVLVPFLPVFCLCMENGKIKSVIGDWPLGKLFSLHFKGKLLF